MSKRFFNEFKSMNNSLIIPPLYGSSLNVFSKMATSLAGKMSLIKNTHKKVILDACASPGGKTIKLALENPDSLIISNEISFSRYKVLKENIERMGLKNVIATNHSLDFFLNDFKNYFDIVILDAPCSGSGMYRKQKEVLLDWSMDKVYRLSKLQKELIDIAANLITPSGQLIYSTCSFSKEEDEDVKDYFLNKHQNFSSIKVNADECYFSLDESISSPCINFFAKFSSFKSTTFSYPYARP